MSEGVNKITPKARKIFKVASVMFFIIAAFLGAFYYGAFEACENTGGQLYAGLVCVDIDTLPYCQHADKVYEKSISDYAIDLNWTGQESVN